MSSVTNPEMDENEKTDPTSLMSHPFQLLRTIALVEKDVRKNEKLLKKWKLKKAKQVAQTNPAGLIQPVKTNGHTIPTPVTNAVTLASIVDSGPSSPRRPAEASRNDTEKVRKRAQLQGATTVGKKSAHSQIPVPKIVVGFLEEKNKTDRIQNQVSKKNIAIGHAIEEKRSANVQVHVPKENVAVGQKGGEKYTEHVRAQIPKGKIVFGRSTMAGTNSTQLLIPVLKTNHPTTCKQTPLKADPRHQVHVSNVEKIHAKPLASKRYLNLMAMTSPRRSSRIVHNKRQLERTIARPTKLATPRQSKDLADCKKARARMGPGRGNSAASNSIRTRIFPNLPDSQLGGDPVDFELPDDIFLNSLNRILKRPCPPELQKQVSPDTTNPACQVEKSTPEFSDRLRGSSDLSRRDRSGEMKTKRNKTTFESTGQTVSGDATEGELGAFVKEGSLSFGCSNDDPIEAVHCCEVEGNRVVILAQRRRISIWMVSSTHGDKGRLVKQIMFPLEDNASWRSDGFCTSTDVGMLVAQHSGQMILLTFYGYALGEEKSYSAFTKEASLCNEYCTILSCRLGAEQIMYAHVNEGYSCLKKYSVRRSSVKPVLAFNRVVDSLNSLVAVSHLENAIIGFSKQRVYIWNHNSGVLVKIMQTCDGIKSGWFSKCEAGILLLGVVLSNQNKSHDLQLFVSNPVTSVWRNTSVEYAKPDDQVTFARTYTHEHGRHLVGITETGSICMWNPFTGELVLHIRDCRATSASILRISQTRSLLAVGDGRGHVNTYRLPF